ncbi:NigD-like C-terminal domain-containing protein, partial [Bacteroides heparinolyticus]
HLELRYNDYDDLTGRRAYAAVSYNLNSLKITHDIKGIKLKLHSEVNGKVEIAFDKSLTNNNIKEVNIPDLSDMQLQ